MTHLEEAGSSPMKSISIFAAGLVCCIGLVHQASAAIVVDFETLPALPAQPNNFAAAGPMQTYSSPGVFTVSGGVALGNPTFLAAFPSQGSAPNAYGTSDLGDPSLLDTITFTFPE